MGRHGGLGRCSTLSEMTPEDDRTPEDRRKHLEFIQAAITRQATNSFQVRGWALTIAAAFYGYAANKDAWAVAVIGVLVSLAFWYLDAFYLRQERLFRCLYGAVVKPTKMVPQYSMNTLPYQQDDGSRLYEVLWSRPVAVFFGVIVAVGVIVAAMTGFTR